MSKKRIAIIFTGGTISMKVDTRLSAAVPSLSGEEIMSLVTSIDEAADTEIYNFSTLPSPSMCPQMMYELSEKISEFIDRDDIDGVVVTHGTDTLEETAYFLDLACNTNKPIVVVGAMRNGSELNYDGPSNLSSAVIVAASDKARGKGVLVVMNDQINSAIEVTKTHTLSLDTFKSLEFGPLGIVDQNKVLFYRESVHERQFIPGKNIDKTVEVIKIVAGSDSRYINYLVDNELTDGLVIEAMGRGNVPPAVVEGITKAINHNIPVVLVSRCPMGRVLDSYGYYGGGKSLRNLGVIFGGNLNGQKARIKLLLALCNSFDYDKIKQLFEGDSY